MLRIMSYCDHCEGQRFDRARILRTLRQIRQQVRAAGRPDCDRAIELALHAVRELDVPHLDLEDLEDEIIH